MTVLLGKVGDFQGTKNMGQIKKIRPKFAFLTHVF